MKQIFSIVGTHFCGSNAEEIVKALKPGDALTLVRDPTNKFDKNAIAVYVGADKVGYIPRGKNVALAATIDMTGVGYNVEKLMAMDQRVDARAIDAIFVPSPNSAFPQVEVG